jgi:hypothetical protein
MVRCRCEIFADYLFLLTQFSEQESIDCPSRSMRVENEYRKGNKNIFDLSKIPKPIMSKFRKNFNTAQAF